MAKPDPRLRDPISRTELERRWRAVRAVMDEADIDAVVVQGAANLLGIGGYFRWLTGAVTVGSYPTTAIFPRQGDMTIISHGPFKGEYELDPASDVYPGAGRRLTSPALPMINFTAHYDADLAVQDIKRRGCRSIALLGSSGMGHDFTQRLLNGIPSSTRIASITDQVDWLKAIKSEEEIALIRRAAKMQDELMLRAVEVIKPGLREFEVSAHLAFQASMAGCETGFILGGSGQMDQKGPPMFPVHSNLQGKTLREGDMVIVVAENSGAGGYVTHISRLFMLGKTPPEIADRYAAVLEAQDYTVSLLTPGASCSEAFANYNAYMRQRGFGEELRLHAHGQGFDIVERPLIRSDETMTIAPSMNIGIHPMIMHRNVLVFNTDNYLTGTTGSERLHHCERKIFEIG